MYIYIHSWSRKQQSTPVFWPGEVHGQRSQVGYSPQGHKESDTPEHVHTHTHTHTGAENAAFFICDNDLF